jgi:hypothetical protein
MWVIGPIAPATPALLKTQSTSPHADVAAASAASTCASSATFVRTKRTPSPCPACFASATVSFPVSTFRSATTTPRAPSARNASTDARPIPLPPPVTTATLPASRPAIGPT